MSNEFFKNLANAIDQKYGSGSSEGDFIGSLGDYADKVDFSEERMYLEKGYFARGSSDYDVHSVKYLWQENSATVLVKKKMFSSLGEYNKAEYLDNEEKLFLKSSKVLFKNKCKQISAIEQLTKLEKYVSNTQKISDSLLPIIMSLSDEIAKSSSISSNAVGFLNSVNRIKQLIAFSPASNTTWLVENIGLSSSLLNSAFSNETGVIELTNFSNITTACSTSSQAQSANITITDPYGYMRITEEDIEKIELVPVQHLPQVFIILQR